MSDKVVEVLRKMLENNLSEINDMKINYSYDLITESNALESALLMLENQNKAVLNELDFQLGEWENLFDSVKSNGLLGENSRLGEAIKRRMDYIEKRKKEVRSVLEEKKEVLENGK